MEECITELANKLKLTEKEERGVVFTPAETDVEVQNGSLCLVANRFFGGDMVLEAMRKAWMVTGDMGFKAVGNNIFFYWQ